VSWPAWAWRHPPNLWSAPFPLPASVGCRATRLVTRLPAPRAQAWVVGLSFVVLDHRRTEQSAGSRPLLAVAPPAPPDGRRCPISSSVPEAALFRTDPLLDDRHSADGLPSKGGCALKYLRLARLGGLGPLCSRSVEYPRGPAAFGWAAAPPQPETAMASDALRCPPQHADRRSGPGATMQTQLGPPCAGPIAEQADRSAGRVSRTCEILEKHQIHPVVGTIHCSHPARCPLHLPADDEVVVGPRHSFPGCSWPPWNDHQPEHHACLSTRNPTATTLPRVGLCQNHP